LEQEINFSICCVGGIASRPLLRKDGETFVRVWTENQEQRVGHSPQSNAIDFS
jgi:hypothetical protein